MSFAKAHSKASINDLKEKRFPKRKPNASEGEVETMKPAKYSSFVIVESDGRKGAAYYGLDE